MLPCSLLALIVFSVATGLLFMITFPFTVGLVRVMGSTPCFGSMVCWRCFPRHIPSCYCGLGFVCILSLGGHCLLAGCHWE